MLLVHLGAVGALASGAALCGGGGACACGALLHALHPLQLWTVCGLHADRAAAIAAPLHYAALVSAKKARTYNIISIYSFLYVHEYHVSYVSGQKYVFGPVQRRACNPKCYICSYGI